MTSELKTKKNDPSHVLFSNSDKDAPSVIKDSNGDVVLGLCKFCSKAEIELEQPCSFPKPFAYAIYGPDGKPDGDHLTTYNLTDDDKKNGYTEKPLYAAPDRETVRLRAALISVRQSLQTIEGRSDEDILIKGIDQVLNLGDSPYGNDTWFARFSPGLHGRMYQDQTNGSYVRYSNAVGAVTAELSIRKAREEELNEELISVKRQVQQLISELGEVKQKLRMVVSHATMGATDGEGMHVNCISVNITACRNKLYNRASEIENEAKVPLFFCTPADCREMGTETRTIQVAFEMSSSHTIPLYREPVVSDVIAENERMKDHLSRIASAKSYSSAYLKRIAKEGLADVE